VVVSVRPEALSTTAALDESIRIEFSETISERPTSGLMADAVIVSPETPDARVRHRGAAIEVELPGGLRAGVVYRVTVLPVLRDLFGNTMREPFEFVFSSGGELNPSAVVGLVVDRVTGRPTRDVIVHAVDSAAADGPPVAHAARTDTGGVYVLRYLPAGSYSLVGFLDRNRNRMPDSTEVQGGDTLRITATDTAFVNFALLEPDSTTAALARAEVPEPGLVRLTFDDYLDPEASLAVVGAVLERVDGQGAAPSVEQLIHEHRFLAIRQEARQSGVDTTAAAPADTTPAPPTVPLPPAADSTPAAPAARPAPSMPLNFVGRAQGVDSVSLGLLGLMLPSRVVYAQLSDTLHFSVDYVLRIQGVPNLAGLTSGVDTVQVSRGAPPAAAPPLQERRR
jgi:hypothetical protein